ncbi:MULTISPECIES: transposase [Burkholderia]|uniref:transposase n=1 Tax=Burkholderia TaxID=32008 RepID=UPI002F4103FC
MPAFGSKAPRCTVPRHAAPGRSIARSSHCHGLHIRYAAPGARLRVSVASRSASSGIVRAPFDSFHPNLPFSARRLADDPELPEERLRRVHGRRRLCRSIAYVDQGYTGEAAQLAAQNHGIELEVAKHTEAKRGFVLLPRRWVVERSFAWATRFRRLARDYERWPQTLAGFRFLAFTCLMLTKIIDLVHIGS